MVNKCCRIVSLNLPNTTELDASIATAVLYYNYLHYQQYHYHNHHTLGITTTTSKQYYEYFQFPNGLVYCSYSSVGWRP